MADSVKVNGNVQWFGQSSSGLCYQGDTGLETNFFDLAGRYPGIDNGQPTGEFNDWDVNLQLFSPMSPPLNFLGAPSTAEATGELVQQAENISIGLLAADDQHDDKEPADSIYSQLTDMSQRAIRAARRLSRPDSSPPSVSSLDVNDAFEDTNTLIRIISTISTSATEDEGTDFPRSSALMGHGNTLMTLAAHQHLMSLFTSICNAISQHLKSMPLLGNKPQKQDQQRKQSLHQSEFGPPSILAQFVMVLQLLMHLINRLDRSLFHVDSMGVEGGYVAETIASDLLSPARPAITAQQSTLHTLLSDRGHRRTSIGSPSIQGGLPAFAQAILKAIPEEHENLRQIIKELQTRMEHPELH